MDTFKLNIVGLTKFINPIIYAALLFTDIII